jgi:hypothetical protein
VAAAGREQRVEARGTSASRLVQEREARGGVCSRRRGSCQRGLVLHHLRGRRVSAARINTASHARTRLLHQLRLHSAVARQLSVQQRRLLRLRRA